MSDREDEKNHKVEKEERRVKFRVKMLGSAAENAKWYILITVASFFLSAFLSFVSSGLKNTDTVIALIIVFAIIFVGIIFDIIGIAVTAADEAPFHAMASRKVYGAKQAILMIKHANKVASFCNDVVGDIAGVISGTASAYIIVKIAGQGNASETTVAGLIITGMVASLTVGGKAIGKTIAIHNSNYIVYKIAVITKFFVRNKKKKKSSKHHKNV
ncbi:MAG: Mg2+ and Co2+ transporter CorB [Bacillota bacterium]|nr:Mg2+ and Co2+ transporter CorB [Bacillota bacterium]